MLPEERKKNNIKTVKCTHKLSWKYHFVLNEERNVKNKRNFSPLIPRKRENSRLKQQIIMSFAVITVFRYF